MKDKIYQAYTFNVQLIKKLLGPPEKHNGNDKMSLDEACEAIKNGLKQLQYVIINTSDQSIEDVKRPSEV